MLGSLVLVAGLLMSQSLLAASQPDGSPDTDSLAGEVDLRPAFEKWGLGPRLQGKRGTCSVFAVAAALEYVLVNKRGQGTQLSVEYLNWASNQALGEKQDGSFFSDLWRGFTILSVCPEQDMPYQDEFDPNRIPSKEARERAKEMHEIGLRLYRIKPRNPNTGVTEKHLATIKQVLDRRWPVCGGFRWPKKPVRWKDDVLETPPPEGVSDGHSLLLVGYRDDPAQADGGLFIFRNSNNNGREGYVTGEYARAYTNDAAWIDYETKGEGRSNVADTGEEPHSGRGDSPISGCSCDVRRTLPSLRITSDDVLVSQSCRIVILPDMAIEDKNNNGVIQVVASDIEIEFAEGSVLRGSPPGRKPDEYSGYGIRIEGQANVVIRSAEISGFWGGLWATGTNGLALEGIDVSDNRRACHSRPAHGSLRLLATTGYVSLLTIG